MTKGNTMKQAPHVTPLTQPGLLLRNWRKCTCLFASDEAAAGRGQLGQVASLPARSQPTATGVLKAPGPGLGLWRPGQAFKKLESSF